MVIDFLKSIALGKSRVNVIILVQTTIKKIFFFFCFDLLYAQKTRLKIKWEGSFYQSEWVKIHSNWDIFITSFYEGSC